MQSPHVFISKGTIVSNFFAWTDIEKLESDKQKQMQQLKEGDVQMQNSEMFELESTRSLVQQY